MSDSSHVSRLSCYMCNCVFVVPPDGSLDENLCEKCSAQKELVAAAESAEKSLRGMALLADTFDNEDDAAIMLQKADRLRDALVGVSRPNKSTNNSAVIPPAADAADQEQHKSEREAEK